MADPYFRRHILVQFLIVLQYLLGSSSREREPPSQAGKPGPAKPTHVLAEPQEVWVNEAHKRILDELRLTPPDGRRFAETVLMVLKRDKNWVYDFFFLSLRGLGLDFGFDKIAILIPADNFQLYS